MGIIMGNILAIYRKELQSYISSPFAYLIAGIFWFLAGFFFSIILQQLIENAAAFDLQRQQFGGQGAPSMDVPYLVVQNFLGSLSSIALVILPMLSMGLYTEERKRGTLELLATSPITNWAVALGKLLGVLTFFVTLLMPLLIYEAIALGASNPPFSIGIVLLGHGAVILLAASILSLGMFISSLTDSTILSAILTFALVIFLWVIDGAAKSMGGPMGDILSHLSLLKHYTNLIQGVVDSSSLLVFASYIFTGLFLTAQSIDALRYQRS
ncbi:MAG: ABC transporter permease subunit [Synechococcales bacterium]|nr:ABC transporter permease subunit [Synechococcales bacterium]